MRWYYWVPICWVGVNFFVITLLLVGRLLGLEAGRQEKQSTNNARSYVVGGN